ncbi:hypothetical protein [Clostridium sp. Cult2]|uniref:hypothetical protein n=1 Tax=Clostridium sp. Cult2 TaxID=2079003 RepID=UPI001F2E990B|nr:hypothetical protein [Clostridium sp. Cult2]MCF6465701.1 hypothetical protein [Clostridium sp. Cult2]
MNQWSKLDDDLDISKLTDEELKSIIIELNDAQLYYIRNMSYYYLSSRIGKLIELVEVKNYFDDRNNIDEKKIILNSYNVIINSFMNFHEDMVEKEIEERINTLLDTREKLYDLAMALNAYEVEISYIKELIDYHIMKTISKVDYKDVNLDKIKINTLINRTRRALDSAESNDIIFMSIVSNILSIIPFRMSKYKYFDLIKSTLIRNFSNYPLYVVKTQIEEYKTIFDSRYIGDYGIVFDNYFTNIQKYKNINIKSKSLDEIENITKDIVQLMEEINKWSIFIRDLGVILNRLMVIYMTKKEIPINLKIRDNFKKWDEYYQNRDEKLLDSLIKTCDSQLTTLEKGLLNGIKKLEITSQEASTRQGFNDENLNKEILFTGKVLTYYNDMKFTRLDLLYPDKYEIVEKDYLIQLIDNLIQYINRSISTMSNLERKIRMRRLLSILQLPFKNIREFFTYIEYSLDDRAISIEEVLFTLDAVNYLLDEYIEGQ